MIKTDDKLYVRRLHNRCTNVRGVGTLSTSESWMSNENTKYMVMLKRISEASATESLVKIEILEEGRGKTISNAVIRASSLRTHDAIELNFPTFYNNHSIKGNQLLTDLIALTNSDKLQAILVLLSDDDLCVSVKPYYLSADKLIGYDVSRQSHRNDTYAYQPQNSAEPHLSLVTASLGFRSGILSTTLHLL
ncbi:hypothetical protein DICVIV_04356 [Dictyocaulus viviparus]|uniref:Uncharacterized protein n=1 Tax=Dictyocaulus viviparus TaxID=29172 RepID=A0A0D8Y062_DICVI|nr:hypothetical protein DICVIV_04356 [Dictyocaulus viviparus]